MLLRKYRRWTNVALCFSLGVIASAVPPTVELVHLRLAPTPTLEWNSNRSNWLSTVESKDAFMSDSWQSAPGVAWPSPVTQWSDPRPVVPGGRFYRVTLVPPAGNRGRLDSHAPLTPVSADFLRVLFQLKGIPIVPQHGIQYTQVIYETIDAYGAPVLASGLVVLPMGVHQAAMLAYDHGTSLLKADVPSQLNAEGYLGIALGSAGYVAALPDYLGLGDSPGLHPYLHASSEASATVDLLRATRTLCQSNHVGLNGQLFLSGYSQGGHSALATLRELEASGTNEFTVTACGAGSGPYDLAGVSADDFLSGRAIPNPYYFLYLLGAYQDVYGLSTALSNLLVSPYSATLPPLLDGLHDGPVINAAMPRVLTDILTPAALADFQTNPQNPLRLALRENTLLDWTPKSPLRLYRCSGDRDVLPANSEVAYTDFQAHGATQVQLLDPDPGADHDGCAIPALLAIKAWFDSLRQ